MGAETKVRAVDANPNLKIWEAVSTTDPRHTKKVNQRGGFTAISAHYQVMQATAQFGPIGIGWGYSNGDPIFHDSLVIVPVTLWHGKRDNTFGPVYGGAEWRNANRLDSDAAKKAATDGLTKALSQLGFNADVFLGRFDDNKYVEELRKEFAANDTPTTGETPPNKRVTFEGTFTSPTALKTAAREFVRTLEGMGDLAELLAYLETDDAKDFCAQLEKDMPDWWHGGPSVPAEFVPLQIRIDNRKRELGEIENIHDESWKTNPVLAG